MMMETIPSGTILHRCYRVERVLGSGGFGHVYLAIDLRTNQQYALKEYLVSGASGQEQLQHEVQMLSQLHHPNLPVFRDAFSERGRYYVVLSYIEGNDLTDLMRVTRMRNEAIPLARLLGWMISMCDAVNFLHNQHPPVIHRDIKPDNIRIMPNGTAVLVDLGNAKEAADGKRTLLFIRHQGTPGYAPPEQYPGGSGTDARSDVYALGGTLYFALTTQEPPSVSTRNQSLQQGQYDLPSLQQVLANNPPEDADPQRHFRLGASKPQKPGPRHLRHVAQLGTLPPQLLDQLNRIIARAMALRPDKRYQSVAEMSSDLRKVLTVLPAPPPQATPSRPVDPHSTQPDLPQLYETVQAAKEQAARSVNPTTAQPAGASVTCPRCGAIITDQSAYCRVCGTPLRQPPRDAVDPPASPLPDNTSTKQQPTSSSGNDEETIMIQPRGQAQNQIKGQASKSATPTAMTIQQPPMQQKYDTQSASSQSPQSNGSAPVAQAAQAATAPAKLVLPPAPAALSPWQTAQAQSAMVSPPAQNPPSFRLDAGRSSTQTRILILAIALLVVLIVLLIVFLVLHGLHSHASASIHEIRQSIEVQAASYERNVSLSILGISGITVSTAFAPAWLWTCCAGVPAVTGITR